MEEDIKILEDYIELIKKGYCEDCNELCNIFGTPTYPSKKISEASEHLIKAYKELENKLSEYKTINDIAEEIKRTVTEEDLKEAIKEINDDYIPVSLVEETKKELYENYINSDGGEFLKLEYQLEILEKLLEKRK